MKGAVVNKTKSTFSSSPLTDDNMFVFEKGAIYTHPTKAWVNKTLLSAASVISNLTIDSTGHPTGWSVRNLTPSDIGAATDNHNHDGTYLKTLPTHGHTWTEVTGKPSFAPINAEQNVQSDWNAASGDAFILNKPTIPTNNNQLTNGAGYITGLSWSQVTSKPTTFAPSSHTHPFASLTSKPTTIAGYGITDGLDLRASNLAGDLSTAEKDGIKTKLSITNGITGAGTASKLAKFTASGAIGDSALTETAAGNIGVATTNPLSKLHVNGKASFGDSVTTGNAIRAYNMISTDAAVRILRVSPDIDTAAPAIELMHRTTPDGVDTAFWDFFVDNSGAHIRNRIDLGDIKRLTVTDDGIITDKYKLKALNAVPATATSTGTLGEIRYTADYVYVCTATNTWKRSALTTW